MARRVGVFGGSFDPIHVGHLMLAEFCRDAARLDEVRFIPAAQAPHKDRAEASNQSRLEMLRLATLGNPHFVIDECELHRGGRSFTVDTLEDLASRIPDDELFLLMGSDSLSDFPTWRMPERICELATPLVVHRGGTDSPDWSALEELVSPERLAEIARMAVGFPAVEISSSEMRNRIGLGRSIRYFVPRAVEEYIRHQRLYQRANA